MSAARLGNGRLRLRPEAPRAEAMAARRAEPRRRWAWWAQRVLRLLHHRLETMPPRPARAVRWDFLDSVCIRDCGPEGRPATGLRTRRSRDFTATRRRERHLHLNFGAAARFVAARAALGKPSPRPWIRPSPSPWIAVRPFVRYCTGCRGLLGRSRRSLGRAFGRRALRQRRLALGLMALALGDGAGRRLRDARGCSEPWRSLWRRSARSS